MPVVRQPRHDNVVTALEQIARETGELRRTGAHSVQQDDRAGTPLAVQVRDGTPFVADGGMVAFEKLLEPF